VRHLVIYALVLALSAVPACARNIETETATTLARGLSALSAGDYVAAEERCLAASTFSATSKDAHECILLAAIHLRHWAVATSAADALTALLPGDPWLAAVASQVRFRHDPSLHQGLSMDRPEMAWACIDKPCSSPASLKDAEMRMLATLHAIQAGNLPHALELSSNSPADSQLADIHLLLLARMQEFGKLRQELARTVCTGPDEAGTVAHLRATFAPDQEVPEGCRTASQIFMPQGASATVDLNSALAAMRAGDYAVAATWLERCTALAPTAVLPLLFEAVNAILAQDDAKARQHLLALPPNLPSNWRGWIRKLPHRSLL
jgi:hypothetical protein